MYRHLDDRTFARHAHLELDPLVSTDLERELLARFEASLDDAERVAALDDPDLDTVEDVKTAAALHQDYGHLDLRGIAAVLIDEGIDTPEALRRALVRERRISTSVSDLADALSQLQQALEAKE